MDTAPAGEKPNAPHILVLQEDPSESGALEKILTEKGYRVTVSANGSSAFSQLGTLLPDIIVSDLVVPDLDGPSLTARIKQDEQLHRIQVILLTRQSRLDDLLQVLACGADAFLPKPVNPGYVSSLIEYVLANQAVPHPPETVRTRFRVAYEGSEYAIITGRRQLLDFLLSAYEIMGLSVAEAVQLADRVAALLREMEEKEAQHTLALQEKVAELTRDIEGYRTTGQQLEAALGERDRENEALHLQIRGLEHQVRTKTHEAEERREAAGEERAARIALEGKLRETAATLSEKSAEMINRNAEIERLATALRDATAGRKGIEESLAAARKEQGSREGELQNRIDELVNELSDTRAEYDAAQRNLQEECEKSAKLEEQLDETRKAVERTETQLRKELAEKEEAFSRRIRELETAMTQMEEELRARTAAEEKAAASAREERGKTEAALRSQLADKESSSSTRVRELEAAVAKMDEELKSRTLAVEIAAAAIANREKEEFSLRKQAGEMETRLSGALADLETARKEIAAAEARAAAFLEEKRDAESRAAKQAGSEEAECTGSPDPLSGAVSGDDTKLIREKEARPGKTLLQEISAGLPALCAEYCAIEAIPESQREGGVAIVLEKPVNVVPVKPAMPPLVQPAPPVNVPPPSSPPSPPRKPSRDEAPLVKEQQERGEAQLLKMNAEQWFALAEWAHHAGQLSSQERGHIVIMGRLAKKGREPNGKQLAFACEILKQAESLGYRPGN
jgi:CheY-like chemotaxis protein